MSIHAHCLFINTNEVDVQQHGLKVRIVGTPLLDQGIMHFWHLLLKMLLKLFVKNDTIAWIA